MPISRKVAGSRMGKGKGKLAGWSTELPSGIMMFEFKNLRFGRFMYFINQVNSRIPSKTMVILNHRNKIQLPLNKSKMINYDVVW
jgi:ribosomal protein L16/L10AE